MSNFTTFAQKHYLKIGQSKDGLFSHLTSLVLLHYLEKTSINITALPK